MERQLTTFLLIGIWLFIHGCGEQEISAPTVVADTTPPTVVGANVQGGQIPVNTPIVLMFSERVDLTSAQRGVSVRSSIDAEPVKGIVTFQKGGLEVKFTPTEKMTSGAYVLTAIGIEDTAGNILMMPVTIFFGAVEVDTEQPPADITPPRVVSSIPADGQSADATGSLTVRFDEEIDAASAQAGILVSGVEGTVGVTGAVAIFKPKKPMQAGIHKLAVIGIRDLAGNVMEPSLIIPFEVIAPPPEIIVPPTGGLPPKGNGIPSRVSNYGGGHQIWFEAEDYDERDPDTDQFYPVVGKDGAFGKAITRAGGEGGMIRWTFDISAAGDNGGTWYFWYRGINPSNSSDYMLVEGDPDDAEIPAGPPYPGTDEVPPFINGDDRIFEEDVPDWDWARAGHEEGHTKELRDGVNTMYIFHRQGNDTVFWDVFMWTDDPAYTPTDADYQNAKEVRAWQAAERAGRLASVWGRIRAAW
jgi:hypothetical protein